MYLKQSRFGRRNETSLPAAMHTKPLRFENPALRPTLTWTGGAEAGSGRLKQSGHVVGPLSCLLSLGQTWRQPMNPWHHPVQMCLSPTSRGQW